MIYYLLAAVFVVVMLSATFVESTEGALFGLFFLGGATYWYHPDLLSNPASVWVYLLVGAVYSVIGGFWSIFKWHRWLVSQQSEIQDAYDSWKKTKIGEFEESYGSQKWWPSRNKDKILHWISWWPFSVFWYVVYDLLNNLWSWVYAKLEGVYRKITAAAFSRVVK